MSEGAVGGEASGGEAGGEVAASPSMSEELGIRAEGGIETVPADAPVVAEWAKGMDADTSAFIGQKGWVDAAAVVKSYQNLEKLHGKGADSLAAIPNWDNAEEVTAFNQRLGVPGSSDQYETPEVLVGGAPLEAEVFQKMSAELGHRPGQHQKFAELAGEYFAGLEDERVQSEQTALDASRKDLETEWGAAYDERKQLAANSIVAFKVPANIIDGMEKAAGFAETMKFFADLGRRVGEKPRADDAENNDGTMSGGRPTQAEALAQLDVQNKDTAFYEKLKAGDQQAVQKRDYYKRIASGRS